MSAASPRPAAPSSSSSSSEASASAATSWVPTVEGMTPERFDLEFVSTGRAVLLKGLVKDTQAVKKWSLPFFRQLAPRLPVRLKDGYIAKRQTLELQLGEYVDLLEAHAQQPPKNGEPLPYLHDLPLMTILPELHRDMEPFPLDFFPRFYRENWWTFTQFFLGPKHSLTPLHFDCLETNNLFFQLHGSKRFFLIRSEDREHCYLYDWRWSHVDAEAPDYERFPDFRNARVAEVVVEAGDVLYMPPGTLHQVRGLEPSVSFNIDWHTRESAWRGVAAAARGMPLTNVRYNAVMAAALSLPLPQSLIMRFYGSYLNYIS